ncbi:SRPBCC family protein [Wenxinia marina]|uniref:Activator of Hsp90 ATPase homologue 1/2-like C-terminal domain-containing protein n=1 Tax=Wenxinia marina DSM 24838 TaxID=1123501 RepID=A0A0D0NLA3_9RHOB|nr:SRPBCC domain-containing protein [Wenxinia marina]KIQ69085.1 hypothetical protein Wenmar_02153 [Wenxinia marina DSM 24838]GGL70186.1 activator of HSP90 ATPase [Wenxinia marina]
MNDTAPDIRTVVIERDLAHPPERVWRALTQPALMAEWLMKSDFAPEVGHGFTFEGDWGAVDGRVLEVETGRRLRYTWEAMGLESVVTWTLTETEGGTRLRMEQTGFRPDQTQAFHGARYGWTNFLDQLQTLLDTETPE